MDKNPGGGEKKSQEDPGEASRKGYKEKSSTSETAPQTMASISSSSGVIIEPNPPRGPEVPTMNFVSRIRGARDVHSLTAEKFQSLAQSKRNGDPNFTHQEHFNGAALVHPYYDFDAKYTAVFADDEARVAEETARLTGFQVPLCDVNPNLT